MKKIFLLLFCAALILVPLAKVGAIHTYVGVKITSTSTTNTCGAGCTTDNHWCLSGGYDTSYWGTHIGLMYGTGCSVTAGGSSQSGCNWVNGITGSGNTSVTASIGPATPVCPGSSTVVWSPLVDISPSTNYVIDLASQDYCPGVVKGWQCYVAGAAPSMSCNDTCAYYGLTPYNSSTSCYNDNFQTDTDNPSDLANCIVDSGLREAAGLSACSTCAAYAGTLYSGWDTNGNCYYTTAWTPSNTCNALSSFTRVCDCNFNSSGNNFYFAFNTPSSF